MGKLLSLASPALLVSFFSATLLVWGAAAQESNWTGNANVFLGSKDLEEDEWKPAHEQDEFGFSTDFRRRAWPISIELDFLAASGSGAVYYSFLDKIKVESRTSELNIGVRKTWDGFPHVRPYLGGGLAFVRCSAKVSGLGTSVSDSDSGTGLWLGGGVYWTLGSFNIGFDLRGSSAKAEIFNVETDAGGGHFGLLLGYHWGGLAKREAAAPTRPLEPAGGFAADNLEIEKQKLEIEKQKLELEREKLEFEKQKLQKQQQHGAEAP